MIGLDTDVLVRVLMDDDKRQAAQAEQLIADAGPGGAYVSLIVLAETVWVLESPFRLERAAILAAVERPLARAELVIESREAVVTALHVCATGSVDFTDALVGEVNRAAGCSATTPPAFDRRAARLPGFRRVP